jgi:hypothetical protein
MTDEELIKQLRCFDSLSDVPDAAAGRIEELVRELDRRKEMNAELKRYSLIHNPEYQSQMLQRHDGKYVRFADVNPAAIREAALREAAASIQWHITDLKHQNRGLALDLAVYGRDVVLALIGEKK